MPKGLVPREGAPVADRGEEAEGGLAAGNSAKSPSKSILSPEFCYVNSSNTDVAKTFLREKERLEQERREEAAKKLTKIISMRRK